MNKLTKEIAESLVGKYIRTRVKHTEKDAKTLGREYEEQAGYVWRIEQDERGYWWLVYDWGWGVRMDAIVDYWEEIPT